MGPLGLLRTQHLARGCSSVSLGQAESPLRVAWLSVSQEHTGALMVRLSCSPGFPDVHFQQSPLPDT